MEQIIPRWEWRTFGNLPDTLREKMETFGEGKTRESSEIYILSSVSNANTKVRDMLMDIKILQQVNADGLEQWKPVMKGTFPLPQSEIVKVLDSLQVPPPTITREAYTLDQFIEEVIKPQTLLRAVQVTKKRTGFTINGCIAEVADVTVDGIATRTVAVELEDPLKVIETVRMLDFAKYENINYLKGLKKTVGMKV